MAVWRNSDFQVVRTRGRDPFGTPGGLAGSVQGDKAGVGNDVKFGKLTCGEIDNENTGRTDRVQNVGYKRDRHARQVHKLRRGRDRHGRPGHPTHGGGGSEEGNGAAKANAAGAAKANAAAGPGVLPVGKKARELMGEQGAVRARWKSCAVGAAPHNKDVERGELHRDGGAHGRR